MVSYQSNEDNQVHPYSHNNLDIWEHQTNQKTIDRYKPNRNQ